MIKRLRSLLRSFEAHRQHRITVEQYLEWARQYEAKNEALRRMRLNQLEQNRELAGWLREHGWDTSDTR